MRKDLEELGEDSEMEEDFTEDEEEKSVELMGKHSLRTQRNRALNWRLQTRVSPYWSSTLLLARGTTSSGLQYILPGSAAHCSCGVSAYPTICLSSFQDGNKQIFHAPLDFKIFKAQAESVHTYGVLAAFTIAQVEALNLFCKTPGDWMDLVRSCLTPGQYLDWRAFQI